MKVLTRDAILGAEDLKRERVEVPEWGGAVFVQELTGQDRDEWESSIVSIQGTEAKIDSRNLRAKLVSLCVVDEDGKRLFTTKDVQALGRKSAAALDRIVEVSKRMSALNDDTLENLGND